MRQCGGVIAIIALCTGIAHAQATPAAMSALNLEGVTLGEPMRQVRGDLGDPVQFVSGADRQVWRYIEHGGAVFVDVMARSNVAESVTVVRRFAASTYTDTTGISFGTNSADVRAKRGSPSRVSTNSDDGSVDLWYVDDRSARIYEFYGDKLGFIQILPAPQLQGTFSSPESAVPADGTSIADAIRIRPSDLIGNSAWIDAYMAMNQCSGSGHWKETSLKMQADPATNDLLAYTIVHARCTNDGNERDFVFDTHGMLTKTGSDGSQNTIYIDAGQVQPSPQPSPHASPTPD
jgi:hypothetical protein